MEGNVNEESAEQQPSPSTGSGEQRTLASIMFTDVVGFSKLASIDEEKTFRALNRDFDLLYREVAAHGGQVLNTMGDGMMVVFLSAVECMKCALSIQKVLYNLSLAKPPDGALQHRIGLHIGDIFINGKNTMGDGVNQAARIQSLARPESIAMSQEFYTVVEGKVPFEAKNLGGLRAKNIPQNIKIWEVPPIEDEIRQKAADALFSPPPSANIDGATGRRGVLMIVMSMIVIFGGLGIVYMLGATKKSMIKPPEKGSYRDTQEGIDKVAKNLGKLKPKDPVENPEAANQPSDFNQIRDGVFALSVDELAKVDAMVAAHDYEGIVAFGKGHAGGESEGGKTFVAKYERLVSFKQWLTSEIDMTSEQLPRDFEVSGVAGKFYKSADGVTVDQAGQKSAKALWDYKPSTIIAFTDAIVTAPPSGTPATPELADWYQTFKEVHRLS